MKFCIITFGCKVNSYESEFTKEDFLKNGFKYTDDYKTSDIVIVNTCSVTNRADSKCLQMIRDIRRDNKDCVLVLMGCMCENHKEELLKYDVDILIGNKEKNIVLELVENYLKDHKKYVRFYKSSEKEFEDMKVSLYDDLTRAYVKIQDGCNNYCTYCIIPYLRGNIRSKEFDKAVKEVEDLVKAGHKEIVFTGIDTGSYGKETGKFDLTDLIREVSKIDGLERIRLSSIEITEINDKFVSEMKNNPKLCPHLHISLQSGSAKILKLMNRKYTKEEYLERVNKLKNAREDINFTTDVIVGFPNETEEDFLECIDFVKEVGFSKLHVFPYSIRTGTKAEKMDGHLPNEVKKERARRLIKVSDELGMIYNSKFIGKEVSLLVEEYKNGYSIGHTNNFLRVRVKGELEKNRVVNVLIKRVDSKTLDGEIVE